mmetsp:Transcript_11936/g.35190  ORF Transcript_11936/g.35190 Transcript_11936/m.35190 type:complete len:302 (-) Transcript_11936:110-1015(-)
MEARHAAFKDALAHFSPVLNAECLQTCLVVLQRLDLVMELLRHLGLAEAGHALESAICHDRHNTRNNRHINADRAAVLDKLEEDVHVVEKLRDDELTACLNLLLQILDIVPVILLHLLRVIHNCVWVCLRVACHCDAKVITKLFPDELDQVQRAAKAPLDGLKLFLALGRIATQRKDVLDALLLGLIQSRLQRVHGDVGACEVHHSVNTDLVLHLGRDVQGHTGGGAARTPGDVAEDWRMRHHALLALKQVLNALLRARREELEREERLPLRHACINLVRDLHSAGCGESVGWWTTQSYWE